jgi:nucleoside-diphosphate-sugar epimerase
MVAKKVFVTGAGDFVGANLSRRLLQAGHALHLFLRRRSAQWRIEELKTRRGFTSLVSRILGKFDKRSARSNRIGFSTWLHTGHTLFKMMIHSDPLGRSMR